MNTGRSADSAIERLARNQHGAFSHSQAIGCGMTNKMIGRRVEVGMWIRLAPGVYALPSAPSSWRRQYKAAELTNRHAAINGLSAAKLHSVDGFPTAPAEIVVPYTSKTRCPIARVHRATDVRLTVVDNIRVTTLAQTMLDLLARVSVDRLERAIDGLLLTNRLQVDELVERRVAVEASRRPRIATWRALVDERTAQGWVPPESDLEATLWHVLLGLPSRPRLVRQAPLPWWSRGAGRADTLLVEWRTIVEADGRRWHARVRDFDNDRWRDNVAQSHGYRVLRFTFTHLRHRPVEVQELIEQSGRWRVKAA
jgi:very-short-patch-repair endonuclease